MSPDSEEPDVRKIPSLAVGVALAVLITVLGLAAPTSPVAAASSRCTTSGVFITSISCSHNTTSVQNWGVSREVHWQVPVGTAPAGGWPTVLMFQGSFFTAEITWSANSALPYGAYHQTDVVRRLLDAGYAVITPEAHLDSSTFWDTNVPPWSTSWTSSPDHSLMTTLFSMIDSGAFGPLRGTRMYATGISSGGYMTSRMAIAYPSRFRAIAIESASYATCAGVLCSVPTQSASHAPTLFLHGSIDVVVPISTARDYDTRLKAAGVSTRFVSQLTAGHEWLSSAPSEVVSWFNRYP